jgi:hypothetical protein
MTHLLRFHHLTVGLVEETDADFPNIFGAFALAPSDPADPLGRHVGDYVAFSVEASRLMEEDEAAYHRFAEAHEGGFLDLIETDDWLLEGEDGVVRPILVPNFVTGGGVVWRWNPDLPDRPAG